MLSVQKPVSRKNTHYPISDLFLIVLLYIVEAKKGCKKKSLNILLLAADLLKPRWPPRPYMVKIIFSRTGSPMILKLVMQHRGLKLYKVCINGDPGLTILWQGQIWKLRLFYRKK